MAYCSAANVRARLPEFPSDAEHDAILVEAISAAEADVDVALAARYDVPFADPAPDIIRHVAADLAAAWALDTTFSGGGEEGETKLSQSLRKRARERLMEIAEGNWRGVNTLTSRGVVPGKASRPGHLAITLELPGGRVISGLIPVAKQVLDALQDDGRVDTGEAMAIAGSILSAVLAMRS